MHLDWDATIPAGTKQQYWNEESYTLFLRSQQYYQWGLSEASCVSIASRKLSAPTKCGLLGSVYLVGRACNDGQLEGESKGNLS